MSATPLLTPRGHQHREAFCLMWYGCACGHRERFWNGRDGVAPFGTLCPSCSQPTLQHVDWGRDEYAPDHKPAHGQRVWIDMTREAAERYARARIAAAEKQGMKFDHSRFESLVRSFLGLDHGGGAPDCVVTGYAKAHEQTA